MNKSSDSCPKPDVGCGLSRASGPPLWDDGGDAQMSDGAQIEPDWDLSAQPTPDCEVDQSVSR